MPFHPAIGSVAHDADQFHCSDYDIVSVGRRGVDEGILYFQSTVVERTGIDFPFGSSTSGRLGHLHQKHFLIYHEGALQSSVNLLQGNSEF